MQVECNDQRGLDSYPDDRYVSDTSSFHEKKTVYLVYLALMATTRAMLAVQDDLLYALLGAAGAADALGLHTSLVSGMSMQFMDNVEMTGRCLPVIDEAQNSLLEGGNWGWLHLRP